MEAPLPLTIPAFVNPLARRGAAVAQAIREDARFRLEELRPAELEAALRAEIAKGTPRVLVAGGDGTIAIAAGVLAGTEVELAVVPGGTLNHFAGSQGIGMEPGKALEIAASGVAHRIDVGFVNGHAFLNTSAVGVYIDFLRARERWRPSFGYVLSSAWAAVRTLVKFPRFSVVLELEGRPQRYRSPLVFVGVGERELKVPTFGKRVRDGRRGLHLLIIQHGARARLFAMLLAASARGLRAAARTPHLDAFLVDAFTIDLRRGSARVALDGEIVQLPPPLAYRLTRGALRVVAPPTSEQGRGGANMNMEIAG